MDHWDPKIVGNVVIAIDENTKEEYTFELDDADQAREFVEMMNRLIDDRIRKAVGTRRKELQNIICKW